MSEGKIKSHDHFVAKALARDYVSKEFLDSYLPSEIRELIDLSTIQRCNTKLLSNILGEGIVDFLYKVKFINEGEGYISILLEHQSKPDKDMAFRIQKYILRICDEHLRKNPGSKYPLIYPIILYSGRAKYNAPKSFYDLFDNPELAKKFLTEEFKVISIRDIEDDELVEKYRSGAMLYLMKHILEKNIYSYLLKKSSIFEMVMKEDFQYAEDMLYYIFEKADSINKAEILSLFQEIAPPEKKDKIMTIAEELRAEGEIRGRAEGKAEGRVEGKAEGKAEGRAEGKLEVAKKMLSENLLDINTIAKITDLSVDELKTLLH